jgi:predicted nucleotidyltransferase
MTKLKDMVVSALMDEKVKVFVFGSRARGDNHHTSDIDIGLIPYGKIAA